MTSLSINPERLPPVSESAEIGKVKLSTPFVVQIVAWIVAILLTYGAMSSRMAVVESRQDEADRRQGEVNRHMERIEDKLDDILKRLK